MQVREEASGMWVDSCLFLPSSSRVMWPPLLNAKIPCMSCLTTPVQLLCLCPSVLQTSAQRRPYNSIILDFETIPSPSSMEPFCQFCSSVNLKMHLCSNSFYEARDREDATADTPLLKSHIPSFFYHYSIWTLNFAHVNVLKEAPIFLP